MIIALGLLVDDPVVASDAINRELAEGQPRNVAAWLGPQKLARAILYATVTNIVAFLPMLIVTARSGSSSTRCRWVVTASLIASRLVSMTFMPLPGVLHPPRSEGLAGARADERTGFARLYTCGDPAVHRAPLVNAIRSHGATPFTGLSLAPLIGSAFFPKDSAHHVLGESVHA